MAKPALPTGPLSAEEAKAALEASGYPFELRVFKALQRDSRRFLSSPKFGQRMKVSASGETREIDIISHDLTPTQLPSRDGYGVFQMLIQVKRLPHGAFVGLVGDHPRVPPFRRVRAFSGGHPALSLLPPGLKQISVPTSFTGKDFTAPFDRLASVPFCVQWCVAQRGKNHSSSQADHPDPVWEDLANLVRARHFDATERSRVRSRNPFTGFRLFFWALVLVLDAPIFTYNVELGEMTSVDRLTLAVSVQMGRREALAHVDVVTLRGLELLRQDYKLIAKEMAEHFEGGDDKKLVATARDQSERWKESRMARRQDRRRRRSSSGTEP